MFKKLPIALAAFAAIVICASLPVGGGAQSGKEKFDQYGRWINGVSEPWSFRPDAGSEAEAAEARVRWEVIGAENENAKSEWAGDYLIGDLHGAYLRLSANGSFVLMSVFSCEASVTGVDYGRATLTPDLVQLFSERPAKKSAGSHLHSYHVSARRFVPIKWDNQYFLVAEREIARFAAELVGFETKRSGGIDRELAEYFWMVKNHSRPVTGLPIFPAAYQRYMRKPIDTEIVDVGKKRIIRRRSFDGSVYFESRTPVTIGAGSRQGVRPGMSLHLTTPGRESLEVNHVGPMRSTGVITRYLEKDMVESYTDYSGESRETRVLPQIRRGLKVSSSTFRVP